MDVFTASRREYLYWIVAGGSTVLRRTVSVVGAVRDALNGVSSAVLVVAMCAIDKPGVSLLQTKDSRGQDTAHEEDKDSTATMVSACMVVD